MTDLKIVAWGACCDTTVRPGWVPAGQRRRLDPLSKLFCGAADSILEKRESKALPSEGGIILHTAYGALHSTKSFLDSIAQGGDHLASPTPFTTSVHNATAGSLAQLLRLHGHNTTISRGSTGGHELFTAARRLLKLHSYLPGLLIGCGEHENILTSNIHSPYEARSGADGSGAWLAWVERDVGQPGRTVHFADEKISSELIIHGPDLKEHAAATYPGITAMVSQVAGTWWPACGLAAFIEQERDIAISWLERDACGTIQTIHIDRFQGGHA